MADKRGSFYKIGPIQLDRTRGYVIDVKIRQTDRVGYYHTVVTIPVQENPTMGRLQAQAMREAYHEFCDFVETIPEDWRSDKGILGKMQMKTPDGWVLIEDFGSGEDES